MGFVFKTEKKSGIPTFCQPLLFKENLTPPSLKGGGGGGGGGGDSHYDVSGFIKALITECNAFK